MPKCVAFMKAIGEKLIVQLRGGKRDRLAMVPGPPVSSHAFS